jgi:hypothetical protein
MFLTMHAIDHCHEPDTPPTGNKAYLMCYTYTNETMDAVADKLKQMKRAVKQRDRVAWVECNTCAKPINYLHDAAEMERLVNV